MNFLAKLLTFLRQAYSDDGTPSSSRLLTSFLALVCSGVLVLVADHLVRITDNAQLAIWLSNLPYVIGALVFFFTAPYGVNRGSTSITDVLNIFKGKKNE